MGGLAGIPGLASRRFEDANGDLGFVDASVRRVPSRRPDHNKGATNVRVPSLALAWEPTASVQQMLIVGNVVSE